MTFKQYADSTFKTLVIFMYYILQVLSMIIQFFSLVFENISYENYMDY